MSLTILTKTNLQNLIMNTDIFGIGQEEGKIDDNDFSDSEGIQTFRINAVKNEPREIDIFTGSYNSSSGETDYVDYKHATDRYQEQNEEKLDANNSNPDLDLFKFSDNLSTKCDAVQIKNEDDIDIFLEDIKSENNEEKLSQGFGFCQVCFQNFDIETDIFKSTSYRFECSCQKQYESLFYSIHGEDMTHDVKQTSLGFTAVSVLKPPEVQNEIFEDEVTKEQDSSILPRRLSVPSMEIDNKIQRKFFSNLFENNRVNHQMKDITEKIFHCKTCSKSFSQMRYLKVHERRHTGEKPFNCKICSKSFSRLDSLERHERIHTAKKPFRCQICSQDFTSSSRLMNHKKIHTGPKQFHCKFCSKYSTKYMSKLKVHERIHSGEKAFNCKICLKSFSRLDNLKRHERIHTAEKTFYCKISSKSFIQSSVLKFHERIHTGEKPFHCEICSKSFFKSSNLRIHGRIHTGEKPFHCKMCSKYFSQKSHLKRHERIHTGEKPKSVRNISLE